MNPIYLDSGKDFHTSKFIFSLHCHCCQPINQINLSHHHPTTTAENTARCPPQAGLHPRTCWGQDPLRQAKVEDPAKKLTQALLEISMNYDGISSSILQTFRTCPFRRDISSLTQACDVAQTLSLRHSLENKFEASATEELERLYRTTCVAWPGRS